MGKIKRLMEYARNVPLLVLLRPVSAVAKFLNPRLRHVWLIGERGNEARDNGYWFYRHMRANHPEERAIYIITENSPDYEKVASLGETVEFGSLRHHFLYCCAEFLVSTHVSPAAPDLVMYQNLSRKGLRAPGKQIFLQHGIIKDNMLWLHYPNTRIDIFVCGAKKEYEYIRDVYEHPQGVAKYLGLCRFDNLRNAGQPDDMILVMPTWRGARYPKGEAFKDTMFYRYYQELLDSPELDSYLASNGLRLVFYPHVEIQPELHWFHTKSERVVLADKTSYDVQRLLMDCRVLVTDYSSVYFDVAYMEKPVIYYQFDEQEYRKVHYQEGYFDYRRDGFGPVMTDQTSLLEELKSVARRGFKVADEYLQRIDGFFPNRDSDNCERTYQAIVALRDKGESK